MREDHQFAILCLLQEKLETIDAGITKVMSSIERCLECRQDEPADRIPLSDEQMDELIDFVRKGGDANTVLDK